MNPALSLRVVALLACLLTLSGCVRMVASMSEEPTDQHHHKRTFGAKIEDRTIRNKVTINLYRADERLRQTRLKVVSFNGNVLITGEAADEALKRRVTEIAEQVRHVRDVHNEMRIAGASSTLSRMNDGWLTSKTKTRLLFNGDTPGIRTKVVTSNGVVYLMGLMTRAQADAVVGQVQRVYGVQKIVKIIEYID